MRRPIRHLFLFIGAEPNTDWLASSGIELDGKGFVLTGEDAGGDRHALETSRRGVFAIGDVRAKSIKRVAAAVGEGAQVVAALHSYLAATRPNMPLWRPSRWRQLKAAEIKARRDGAAAERPVAKRLRRLPGMSRHDGLRVFAGRKIAAERQALDASRFWRRFRA